MVPFLPGALDLRPRDPLAEAVRPASGGLLHESHCAVHTTQDEKNPVQIHSHYGTAAAGERTAAVHAGIKSSCRGKGGSVPALFLCGELQLDYSGVKDAEIETSPSWRGRARLVRAAVRRCWGKKRRKKRGGRGEKRGAAAALGSQISELSWRMRGAGVRTIIALTRGREKFKVEILPSPPLFPGSRSLAQETAHLQLCARCVPNLETPCSQRHSVKEETRATLLNRSFCLM